MNLLTKDKQKSDLEKLLNSTDLPNIPRVGDIVEGKIISASKNEIFLDINGITTGVIRGKELIDESGLYTDLKKGDVIQVMVLELENERGEMELSLRQAQHQKAWDNLIKLKEEGKIVLAPATEANRGGLMVRIGKVDGFLPVSQLTVEHYPRVEGGDKNKILGILKQFIGRNLKVKVIDVDESDNKLIVSEKAAWEDKQKAVILSYKLGDIVKGKVTGVADFGAFIEFADGLEGLVHISELAWQRIDNPKDFIKVGDEIEAKIIGIDGSKISLSIKALKDDPWKKAIEKYKIGQIVKGKVLKINPFGIFVELDKDIHGLAHISELSEKRISDPSEVVKEGDVLNFKILSIEPENHRLGLSLKAVKERAKDNTVKKFVDLEKKEKNKKPLLRIEK